MYNFRTDLADERRDIYIKANKIENEISGIETTSETEGNIKITKVKILNEEGEKALGKPKGNYVTIDIKSLKIASEEDIENASVALSNALKEIINVNISSKEEILVVGLGNIYVTPDSLGPKVIKDIDVTRHILNYAPQFLEEGTRSVSAISPGVLGTTGIETLEILRGIIENVRPKLVIAVDSLASKSLERINSTIQIADTGISPGAGVGNNRKELTKETLNVPVIGLGIPTVVESAVLVSDCLNLFIEKLQNDAKSNEYLNNLKKQDNYEEIKEALLPKDYNMIVTPKEIDELIENMSSIVARGINKSM